MRGLLAAHGDSKVTGQEAVSNAKAETIYRILDANPEVYQPVNHKSVRSRMNICFRITDTATEKKFLEGAEARMLQGLKGHRSVGGIRYAARVIFKIGGQELNHAVGQAITMPYRWKMCRSWPSIYPTLLARRVARWCFLNSIDTRSRLSTPITNQLARVVYTDWLPLSRSIAIALCDSTIPLSPQRILATCEQILDLLNCSAKTACRQSELQHLGTDWT